MRKLFALFLCLLALSACVTRVSIGEIVPGASGTTDPSVTIHADTAFTASERTSIQEAADLWRRQTDGVAIIVVAYDLDQDNVTDHLNAKHDVMVRLDSDMDAVIEFDATTYPGKLLGFVTPTGGIHNPWKSPLTVGFVADRLEDPDYMRLVVLHEFGHVLGLPHSSSINAVMYPSAIKAMTVCLKRQDLASFCSINDCAQHRMVPCE